MSLVRLQFNNIFELNSIILQGKHYTKSLCMRLKSSKTIPECETISFVCVHHHSDWTWYCWWLKKHYSDWTESSDLIQVWMQERYYLTRFISWLSKCVDSRWETTQEGKIERRKGRKGRQRKVSIIAAVVVVIKLTFFSSLRQFVLNCVVVCNSKWKRRKTKRNHHHMIFSYFSSLILMM